ncbi:hypothetical protein GO013_11315 [Pseudodesulfovibrio sp. JC047]|uniref:hypothetical protein n=1 Tax=Pseudodesulfovibrio sp. JC047 TaxID=2683199 RepID=UPI0013D35939|nr:hypothetical protein [Pseudodesulfovibrio sp. JC047]NDV20011.1 hypothetical protein [Pseudodesulfovibrio sp. JC047]
MFIWDNRDEILDQIAANKAALKKALDPNFTADGDSVEYVDLDMIRANIKWLGRELVVFDGVAGPVAVQGRIRR